MRESWFARSKLNGSTQLQQLIVAVVIGTVAIGSLPLLGNAFAKSLRDKAQAFPQKGTPALTTVASAAALPTAATRLARLGQEMDALTLRIGKALDTRPYREIPNVAAGAHRVDLSDLRTRSERVIAQIRAGNLSPEAASKALGDTPPMRTWVDFLFDARSVERELRDAVDGAKIEGLLADEVDATSSRSIREIELEMQRQEMNTFRKYEPLYRSVQELGERAQWVEAYLQGDARPVSRTFSERTMRPEQLRALSLAEQRLEVLREEAKALRVQATEEAFEQALRPFPQDARQPLREAFIEPRAYHEEFAELGIHTERGVILHGAEGPQLSKLAEDLAEALTTPDNVRVFRGAAFDRARVGEGGEAIREAFRIAEEQGTPDEPYVMVFQKLDALVPSDELSGGSAQRQASFVGELERALQRNPNLVVIGSTTKRAGVPPDLRKPGLFGKEIRVRVPDKQAQLFLLEDLLAGVSHAIDLGELAKLLKGLGIGDHAAVVSEAKQLFRRRHRQGVASQLALSDFAEALEGYTAVVEKQNDISVKKVEWDDIAGADDAIEFLHDHVLLPLVEPERFEFHGAEARPQSVLLYGPPGTGKTLLASALSTHARARLIAVDAGNLTPQRVREVYELARNGRPTVIFIDEAENIGRKRVAGQKGNPVLNQLLTEMDGAQDNSGVVLVAATNLKDELDPALLRPGRLENHVYVGLPDESARKAVFEVSLKGRKLAEGKRKPDLEELARRTEGYTPAQIDKWVREASIQVAKRKGDSLAQDDFDTSFKYVSAPLTPEQLAEYGAPAHGAE